MLESYILVSLMFQDNDVMKLQSYRCEIVTYICSLY